MLATFLALAISLNPVADWATIIKPATNKVPRLEILAAGMSSPSICSGVVINQKAGFLLTAAHCVSGEPAKLSVTVNGRHAEIARVNHLLDLAVIRFSVRGESEMALAAATPPIGTEVAILGYNFGVENLAVQFGRVSQPLNKETKTFWIDGTIIPGQSGGAVIDEKGMLVGMTSRIYYQGPSNIGAAIPVERITDFLEPYFPAKK